MLNKKFEFDLNVTNPRQTLVNAVEAAGYKVYFVYTNAADCETVSTIETATKSKDSVLEFIDRINEVTGLNLVLVDEDLIEEDREVHFHTEDGRFGGIVLLGGMTDDGRLPDIDDTRFQLSYSEEGLIFT